MKAVSVLLSVGAALTLTSTVLANPQPVGSLNYQTDNDPSDRFWPAGPVDRGAGILYDRSVQTGSRFNPGLGGNPPGSGTSVDATFDDIPIPLARLDAGAGPGSATAINVTRVTVGLRQTTNHAGTDVTLAWADVDNVPVNTNLGNINVVGTQPVLPGPGGAFGFVTQLVTFGDGVNTLFTAPVDYALIPGFGSFFIGLVIDDPAVGASPGATDPGLGWRITSGPDANANAMWIFDLDVSPSETGPFNFGAPPAPAAAFYIVVEGTAVPTPGALALAGVAGLVGVRRRRA